VVAHLRDELLAGSELDQSLAIADVQHERLLAEHVQAPFQGLLHHAGVQLARCRHDDGVELLIGEHRIEVCVALQPRVLPEDVGEVGHRVARGDQFHFGMGSHDGNVRQTHLAQSNHANANHHVSF
jgi:hypothetical protein